MLYRKIPPVAPRLLLRAVTAAAGASAVVSAVAYS
jgi:hypothetical protein